MPTDNSTKNCILTTETANRMIRRMALQIAEDNTEASELVLAGIVGNGQLLAKKLIEELRTVSSIPITQAEIVLNKKHPVAATIQPQTNFTGKIVIVIDDVSNSGKTLLYALKPFLDGEPRKIQTLVLVERSHKLFAVQPDYVGLTVATTLQDHISVEMEGTTIKGAWLH